MLASSTSDRSPAVRLHQVGAGYGSRTVLEAFDLELGLRRVTVVVGPGGSGKTTLLRVLGGWTDADFWHDGSLELPGGSLVYAQWQGVPPATSDLVALLTPVGAPSKRQAREVAEKVWAEEPAARDALLSALSATAERIAPWQRRLARFTGSVGQPASIRLFDEPGVDLPPNALDWMTTKLRQIAARETVIMVTHNLDLARRAADSVALMVDGHLIEAGATEAFFSHPQQRRTRDFVRFGS